MSASPRRAPCPSSPRASPEERTAVPVGSTVRTTRNGPNARTSNASRGWGWRSGIGVGGRRCPCRSRRDTQTPRPSGFGVSSSVFERQPRVRAGDDAWETVPRLPGAEVERVVAEQHVVRSRGLREPRGRLVASSDASMPLSAIEQRRRLPTPRSLGDDERGDPRPRSPAYRSPRARRARRTRPRRGRRRTGRVKIRWRGSGRRDSDRASSRRSRATSTHARRAARCAARAREAGPARPRRGRRRPRDRAYSRW